MEWWAQLIFFGEVLHTYVNRYWPTIINCQRLVRRTRIRIGRTQSNTTSGGLNVFQWMRVHAFDNVEGRVKYRSRGPVTRFGWLAVKTVMLLTGCENHYR